MTKILRFLASDPGDIRPPLTLRVTEQKTLWVYTPRKHWEYFFIFKGLTEATLRVYNGGVEATLCRPSDDGERSPPTLWSEPMRLPYVSLLSRNQIFANVRVGRKAGQAILRIAYTSGNTVDVPLYDGWQGVMVGTTLFDVQLTKDGTRIKRASGPIRMFHKLICW